MAGDSPPSLYNRRLALGRVSNTLYFPSTTTGCPSTAGPLSHSSLTMSTELRTKQPKNIIGHDNSSVVNWIHVAVIAPGLVRFCILLSLTSRVVGLSVLTARPAGGTGLPASVRQVHAVGGRRCRCHTRYASSPELREVHHPFHPTLTSMLRRLPRHGQGQAGEDEEHPLTRMNKPQPPQHLPLALLVIGSLKGGGQLRKPNIVFFAHPRRMSHQLVVVLVWAAALVLLSTNSVAAVAHTYSALPSDFLVTHLPGLVTPPPSLFAFALSRPPK
jgi:hypothetical protein